MFKTIMRDAIIPFIVTVALSLAFGFVVLNWLSGCGESFPTKDGTYIQGECITPTSLLRGE